MTEGSHQWYCHCECVAGAGPVGVSGAQTYFTLNLDVEGWDSDQSAGITDEGRGLMPPLKTLLGHMAGSSARSHLQKGSCDNPQRAGRPLEAPQHAEVIQRRTHVRPRRRAPATAAPTVCQAASARRARRTPPGKSAAKTGEQGAAGFASASRLVEEGKAAYYPALLARMKQLWGRYCPSRHGVPRRLAFSSCSFSAY